MCVDHVTPTLKIGGILKKPFLDTPTAKIVDHVIRSTIVGDIGHMETQAPRPTLQIETGCTS